MSVLTQFRRRTATWLIVILAATVLPIVNEVFSPDAQIASAASGNSMVSPISSTVWTEVVGKYANNTLDFGFQSPASVTVCTTCVNPSVPSPQSIGSVSAGNPIVAVLTDHSFPGGTFVSTDPAHAHIYKVSSTAWIIAWEDSAQDNNFTDLFAWVTVGPTFQTPSPAGGSILPAEVLGGHNLAQQCQCGQAQATDYPVTTSTGNFWHTFDDLAIPGRGVGLGLSRTYNSGRAGNDSPFGYGWLFNYSLYLYVSGTTVTVVNENGSQVAFSGSGSSFTPTAPRTTATLGYGSGVYTFTRNKDEIFTFDAGGRLTSLRDLNGYVTTVSYPSSTSIMVTDPGGRVLSFTLNPSGRIVGLVDPGGRTMTFSYDGSGNLTDVIDVGGGHQQYAYSGHLLTTMRSPRFYGDTSTPAKVITNSYDGQSRIQWQSDELGRTTTFSYDVHPGVAALEVPAYTKVTDPAGNVVHYTYMFGQLISQRRGYGTALEAETNFVYDPQTSGLVERVDPNGHKTAYTYDSSGNQTSVTDALGHVTSTTYNSLDKPTAVTNAVGVTSTMTYDAAGNLLSSSSPLIVGGSTENEVTTYVYGDVAHPGDVTAVSDPLGNTTRFNYDQFGNLAAKTDAMGNKTTFGYNAVGQITSSVAPKGNVPGGPTAQHTTTIIRDSYGRVTETRDPLWTSASPTSHRSTATYNLNGQLLTQTDGNGNTTSFTYNAAGELVTTTRPDATTLQSSYNNDGSLATQTDGRGKTTTYGYDALGHLVSTTDLIGRTTSYAYDSAGNLTNKIDPAGTCSGTPVGCTTMTYDAADRLIATSYSDGVTPNVTYSYDNVNRRTAMTDGTGLSTFTYDTLGRLTSHTNGASVTVGYGYDRANRLTAIAYPGNHTVTRTFDLAGQMTSVADWSGHVNRFTYDPNGNITSRISGNGMITTNNFDKANQLMAINFDKGNVDSFSYGRSGNGSVTSQTSTVSSPSNETYGYNTINKLNTYNASTLSYDNGDRITTLPSGSTLSYDDANQITTKTTSGSPVSFSYDTRGNRTSDGVNTFAYDQANRLKSFAAGGVTTSYTYDAMGNRASKTAGGATKPFTYDIAQGLPLILQDDTNSYIYGPNGTPIEQIDASNNVSYLHQDQLGSTRVLTNQNRAVVGTYAYDPYGITTAHSGTSTPLQYAGQYNDNESNLYWMRARYYDPTTAQFITRDPIESQTRAAYAYVNGNPLNMTDPSGLLPGSFGQLMGNAIKDAVVDATLGALSAAGIGFSDFVAGVGHGATFGLISGNHFSLTGDANESSSAYWVGEIASIALPTEAVINGLRGIKGTVKSCEDLKPPEWTNEWQWRGASRKVEAKTWWDPNGGEWRFHQADKWHDSHWDHNAWGSWNSKWSQR